jgi:hypothetical protein
LGLRAIEFRLRLKTRKGVHANLYGLFYVRCMICQGAAHAPPKPLLAQALGVSVETLLDVETAKQQGETPDIRMQRRLQQLEKLSPEECRRVLQLVDTYIERAQLKRRASPQTA